MWNETAWVCSVQISAVFHGIRCLCKSITPFLWIIAFHSTSWHLLISIVHFSGCNSRLFRYLHISSVALIDAAFCLPGTVSGLLCCFEVFFIYLLAGVAGSDGVCWCNASSLPRAVKRPCATRPFQEMCLIISVSVNVISLHHGHSNFTYSEYTEETKAAALERSLAVLVICVCVCLCMKASELNGRVVRWCDLVEGWARE